MKKAARPTRLVVPIYNEAGLVDALAGVAKEAATRFPELKLVFVDDGSRDGSGELLRRALPSTSSVEIQILRQNGGKGHAIRHGFRGAPEEQLIFMDGDLAYSLDHIPALLEALETYDVVIGSRAMAPQAQGGLPARRVFLGWGFNRLACFILGLDYPDTQAGLKGFSRQAAESLFSRQKLAGFAFDVELLYLSRKLGFRVGQVPAQVSSEHSYKTSHIKLICNSLTCFFELWLIRWWSWTGAYRLSR